MALPVSLLACCSVGSTQQGAAGSAQTGSQAGVQAAPSMAAASIASSDVGAAIETLLQTPQASRAHWGISVVDAQTGAALYGREETHLFEPASNAKLFTTAAALALLGPDYTVHTTVVASGTITPDGHLHGALRLVGGADPSLSGRSYPYQGHTARPGPPLQALDDLAAQVAASGIRAVDGPVVGDDTLFAYERFGAGWGWDDLQWEYGAPVSALTVNDNVRYLTVTPGARVGDPVTVSWNPADAAAGSGGATGANAAGNPAGAGPVAINAITAAAGSDAHLGMSREVDGGSLRLFGSLPVQGKPVSAAITLEDPAAFAAQAFAASLASRGIFISQGSQAAHRPSGDTTSFALATRMPLVLRPSPSPRLSGTQSSGTVAADLPATSADTSGSIVASRTSPPLRDIVTVTNKASQNLHAELLLRLLGHVEGEDGSVAQGVRVVRQFLVSAGIDPMDFTFVDGSGLSAQDLVTPRAITALLVYAGRQSWGADYRASLPLGGVDGTLSGRFTQAPLKGRVQAKTGTLSQVNTMSGYLIAASGRMLAFSILCNDFAGEGSRATIDRMVAALASAY